MEKYGSYEKPGPTPQITWRNNCLGSNNTVVGLGLAHAAQGLCNHVRSLSTQVRTVSTSPIQLAMQFREIFDDGDHMAAYTFGRDLLRGDRYSDNLVLAMRGYAMIIEIMQNLKGMEPYQHFVSLEDLFMAWFLSKNDPLAASEILMDRITRTVEHNRKLTQPANGPLGGPMQNKVTENLVKHLKTEPRQTVAELRLKYPHSTEVQQWLDNVEAMLK